MKMAYNAGRAESLQPDLRIDTNLSRSKSLMQEDPPIRNFVQCPNVSCKVLEENFETINCKICGKQLLTTAGEPLETYSFLSLAASLQLLLLDESVREFITNPRHRIEGEPVTCTFLRCVLMFSHLSIIIIAFYTSQNYKCAFERARLNGRIGSTIFVELSGDGQDVFTFEISHLMD
jgi:hypothetical protein